MVTYCEPGTVVGAGERAALRALLSFLRGRQTVNM